MSIKYLKPIKYSKTTSAKVIAGILPMLFLFGLGFALPGTASARAELYIGPIAGLTTAPARSSIPLGTTVEFKMQVRQGSEIRWTGADDVRDDGEWSVATYRLNTPGDHTVTAESTPANARTIRKSCVLHAVDISVDQIHVSPIDVSVEPIVLDENDLNTSTYEYYRWRSIASLRKLEGDRYLTSVGRSVDLKVEVSPPGFAPLIEWRYRTGSEYWSHLGSSLRVSPTRPGYHSFWVGPSMPMCVRHWSTLKLVRAAIAVAAGARDGEAAQLLAPQDLHHATDLAVNQL